MPTFLFLVICIKGMHSCSILYIQRLWTQIEHCLMTIKLMTNTIPAVTRNRCCTPVRKGKLTKHVYSKATNKMAEEVYTSKCTESIYFSWFDVTLKLRRHKRGQLLCVLVSAVKKLLYRL